MRHGTPFLLGQGEELEPVHLAGDRYCYSTDSQKSTSNLGCSYNVATYELGQVCQPAVATERVTNDLSLKSIASPQLMLRGSTPLIKRKRVPSEQFESSRTELDQQPSDASGSLQQQLLASSQREFKRQCPSPLESGTGTLQAGPEGLAAIAVLYQWLLHWKASLKALQAKCILTDDVIYRAVDLFIRYREQLQDSSWEYDAFSDSEQLPSELAACLWLATKTTGNRSCLPSRTLICRATELDPALISELELQILIALDWHVAFNSRLPEDDESIASMSPASQDYAWPSEEYRVSSSSEVWQCPAE